MFLADLTVLRLIATVWTKFSQNSYLREFCAQVSQIVFLADFCRFSAYYYCMSKNVTKLISPRVLCTSITSRIFSWFDRFTTYYYCMSKKYTKLISPRVLCTSSLNRVLSWFDRFTAYYNCMKENVTKIRSARVLCTSVTTHVLSWFDHFTAYYYCIEQKCHKTHISAISVDKNHETCCLADLTVLSAYCNCMSTKISQNSYLHEFCAQVSQIVFLADFTVLRLITTVWSKNVTKIISPRFLWTSITNRVA